MNQTLESAHWNDKKKSWHLRAIVSETYLNFLIGGHLFLCVWCLSLCPRLIFIFHIIINYTIFCPFPWLENAFQTILLENKFKITKASNSIICNWQNVFINNWENPQRLHIKRLKLFSHPLFKMLGVGGKIFLVFKSFQAEHFRPWSCFISK